MIYDATECAPVKFLPCIVTLADGSTCTMHYSQHFQEWQDERLREEDPENPVIEWRYKGEGE